MIHHSRNDFTLTRHSTIWPLIIGLFCAIASHHTVIPHYCVADETPKLDESPITDSDRDHWSFQPVQRPSLPQVTRADWCRTPIDRFILAELEAHELPPAGTADDHTLLRRIYLDVTGLPPTVEEIEAFFELRAQYPHEDAHRVFDHLVDQLLSSPRYGERWAQYWLDLARFAETDGFEHDKLRPNAWKYRDWVIAALNEDLPYDQFIRWQVAGDLLAPDSESAVTATHFCLACPDMPDINSQDERKHTLLDEMTGTVASVILGLQVRCAQCHDHVYDPISQADFYRLRAFFETGVQIKRDQPVSTMRPAADGGKPTNPTYLHLRGDWKRPGPELQAAYLRIADPQQQSPHGSSADDRRVEFAEWLSSPDNPLPARVIANRLWQFHFGKGLSTTPSDFGTMGMEPTHPKLLDWLAAELVDQQWQLKSLHRLILTSAVYRQASRHDSSSMTQHAWESALEADPSNRWYGRFPRRRLDAEVVRDMMLHLGDSLIDEMGGPGVRPPLPEELVETLLKDQWVVSDREADHRRRSIYLFARRNLTYPFFAALDRPSANATCAMRDASTTAPQSLALLNSSLALDAARRFAGRVWHVAAEDPQSQVVLACQIAWSRPPTMDERRELLEFLDRQRNLLGRANREELRELALPTHSAFAESGVTGEYELAVSGAALTDLCLALLNTSEFLHLE
jgi:hypothetical protein